MAETKTKRHGITPQQIQAVGLLAAGLTITEAATQVECSPSTVHRWLKLVPFRAALNQCTRDVLSATLARATSARLQAVQVLMDAMVDTDFPPADRIRAATAVLGLPVSHEPDPRACDPEALEEMERESEMNPTDLLIAKFNL